MRIKAILQFNDGKFIEDIRKCSEVMTYCAETGEYFYLRKCDVLKTASIKPISYYLTEKIFVITRTTMIIK